MKQYLPVKSLLYCSALLTQCSIIGMEYKPKGEQNKKNNPIILSSSQESTSSTERSNQISSLSRSTSSFLSESIIMTPLPTTRGFGFLRSAKDWIRSEEENLFNDLETKQFDINNSSYHRKLSTSIETFVINENDLRLTQIFDICRKDYHNQIKIEDTPALMSHKCLVQKNIDKQRELKQELERADQITIKETNAILENLKKNLAEHIAAIKNQLKNHCENEQVEIKKEVDEIQRLKKGLGHIHKLNRTFPMPADCYCSDDEDQDPEKVTEFYSSDHILRKIEIDGKLAETKAKINSMLEELDQLNEAIQRIDNIFY